MPVQQENGIACKSLILVANQPCIFETGQEEAVKKQHKLSTSREKSEQENRRKKRGVD